MKLPKFLRILLGIRFSDKKVKEVLDTVQLLKLMKGQKLIGVSTSPDYKEWTLHFEDFVLILDRMPFPSPIIERIKWDNCPFENWRK